jgi:hypothetical protein
MGRMNIYLAVLIIVVLLAGCQENPIQGPGDRMNEAVFIDKGGNKPGKPGEDDNPKAPNYSCTLQFSPATFAVDHKYSPDACNAQKTYLNPPDPLPGTSPGYTTILISAQSTTGKPSDWFDTIVVVIFPDPSGDGIPDGDRTVLFTYKIGDGRYYRYPESGEIPLFYWWGQRQIGYVIEPCWEIIAPHQEGQYLARIMLRQSNGPNRGVYSSVDDPNFASPYNNGFVLVKVE